MLFCYLGWFQDPFDRRPVVGPTLCIFPFLASRSLSPPWFPGWTSSFCHPSFWGVSGKYGRLPVWATHVSYGAWRSNRCRGLRQGCTASDTFWSWLRWPLRWGFSISISWHSLRAGSLGRWWSSLCCVAECFLVWETSHWERTSSSRSARTQLPLADCHRVPSLLSTLEMAKTTAGRHLGLICLLGILYSSAGTVDSLKRFGTFHSWTHSRILGHLPPGQLDPEIVAAGDESLGFCSAPFCGITLGIGRTFSSHSAILHSTRRKMPCNWRCQWWRAGGP